MQTYVTLCKQHSGFINVSNSWDLEENSSSVWEAGDYLENYWLPEGYTVSHTSFGTAFIQSPTGNYCDLIDSKGTPVLHTGTYSLPLVPVPNSIVC